MPSAETLAGIDASQNADRWRLRYVSLRDNTLRDADVAALGEPFVRGGIAEFLDLRGNPFAEEGKLALARNLLANEGSQLGHCATDAWIVMPGDIQLEAVR